MVFIFDVSNAKLILCSAASSISLTFPSVFTSLDRLNASLAAFSADRMRSKFTSACTALPTWSATLINFALPAAVWSPLMNDHAPSFLPSPFISVLSVA